MKGIALLLFAVLASTACKEQWLGDMLFDRLSTVVVVLDCVADDAPVTDTLQVAVPLQPLYDLVFEIGVDDECFVEATASIVREDFSAFETSRQICFSASSGSQSTMRLERGAGTLTANVFSFEVEGEFDTDFDDGNSTNCRLTMLFD